MKKILISLMAILLTVGLVGAGAFAVFSDTETSSGNTFTAGTLDLKVDGKDNPNVTTITLSNMKPGDDTGYYKWVLKNTGSLPGKLSATFSPITNDDNGLTEPESAYDSTGGAGQGELGQYLKPGVELCDENGNPLIPGITIIDFNYEEGWCIAIVEEEIDTGGTIGWGPKGWSVPSSLYSIWSTGPSNPWGIPGLNGLGGNTYTYGTLNPGDEIAFFFRVLLDSNLMIWDGTKWIEVDDNIIQSDSVVFNITFNLDQL